MQKGQNIVRVIIKLSEITEHLKCLSFGQWNEEVNFLFSVRVLSGSVMSDSL